MNDPADVYAGMIAALRCELDLLIPQIAAQAQLSRVHVYRLGQGHVRNPSHQTVERLQRLHAQLTTKAGRSVAR